MPQGLQDLQKRAGIQNPQQQAQPQQAQPQQSKQLPKGAKTDKAGNPVDSFGRPASDPKSNLNRKPADPSKVGYKRYAN